MVFKFRLISNEVKGFQRDIEILSEQSFYNFHAILSQSFHYDDSQLTSFFTLDSKGKKLQEITLFDFSEGKSKDIKLMDKCRLKDYISQKGDRLIYVFDYFNERRMSIELTDFLPNDDSIIYPRISLSKLSPPPQLLIIDSNFDDFDDEE